MSGKFAEKADPIGFQGCLVQGWALVHRGRPQN
jgi:hypothetical protein